MQHKCAYSLLCTSYFVLCICSTSLAQSAVGEPIAEVRIEQEGRAVTDGLISGLIETRVGERLTMHDVRETIDHLYGLGRFEDVQVFTDRAAGGVGVRYVLVPMHPVQQVEFRGDLQISEGELRQVIGERYGALPSAGRSEEVARTLQAVYRARGYVQAAVTPRVEQFHDPDRAALIFSINPGPRARILRVDVEGVEGTDRAVLLNQLDLRPGAPYDSEQIRQRLDKYEAQLRSRGYYEARATESPAFTAGGGADVAIVVDRGPLITVAFSGDPLPPDVREELVPVRREASADEDLLEDAARRIEDYLRQRGYRDARADHTREERGGSVVITFDVRRGARHILEEVQIKGASAIPQAEMMTMLRVKSGEPFEQATLDAGVSAIREAYRMRGFTRAGIEPLVSVLPRPRNVPPGGDRRVQVTLTIVEGPRTLVGSIAVEGNTVLNEGQIRAAMQTAPGRPFSAAQLAADRDRVQLEYLNRGYESVVVEPHAAIIENGTQVDIRLRISEGPQTIVDHVIIVGNQRTSTETIRRELLLRPGQPLGYSAMTESQQRLSALGLFRRVRITPLKHASDTNRDVLVQVEEAPPTTVGYGGGVEANTRLRPTAASGQAEERFEVAPRGFFEIGRRNLWGKNRSMNLFTRVSLRARDVIITESGIRIQDPGDTAEGGYGFNEYRVVASYREPKIFSSRADVLVTAILDQAIRSSFNFITREVRAEAGLRPAPHYSVAGRYSFERTKLFDERFTQDQKPLIDRLFPQVRLSKFSISALRDTRDDGLDPNRGTFVSVDTDFAARVWGSEVGFAKTFLQTFHFVRMPTDRRVVLALAARVGAAHGFRRAVARVEPDGTPVLGPDGRPVIEVVEDLPASERFFAGGETTVRGFSLDRLGTAETISESGFPKGGNGLIVLNTELRVALTRAVAAVGFVDAGNVFPKAIDIQVTDLRPAAGFGFHYRSPVGPIRIELGFNLNPRELVPGTLERRSVLHISLGQAF